MKVQVAKYIPNFIDASDEMYQRQILEIPDSLIGPPPSHYIMLNIDYLKDKIGKLKFKFHSLTQSIILYKERPYAIVNLIEL